VRTREWKYIHYPDNPAWDELYRLSDDPLEMANRVAEPVAAATRKELEAELGRLLKETGVK
jgi:arylsulfatase A-like enzyme